METPIDSMLDIQNMPSRRSFLKGAVFASAAVGISSLIGCAPSGADGKPSGVAEVGSGENTGENSAEGTRYTKYTNPDRIGIAEEADQEESFDYAVIGSGITGLSSVMICAEQMPNAKIVLIEKNSSTGGNSSFAEILAPAAPITWDEAYAEGLALAYGSTFIKDEHLFASMYYEASKNSAWIFNKHGVKHDETNLFYEGRAGKEWMALLTSRIENDAPYSNVEIRLNTRAKALLMDDEYTCVGVQVINDNSITNIKAKAVLLATGGLGTNLDLLSYWTAQDVGKCSEIGMGQDGDGHLMVESTAHQMIKGVVPTAMWATVKGFDLTSPLSVACATQSNNIYVNQYGSRFINEDLAEKYPGPMATFVPRCKLIEREGKIFSIMGSNSFKHFEEVGSETPWFYHFNTPVSLSEDLERYRTNENVYSADTLEELADKIGLPKDPFIDSIQAYEQDAAAGRADSAFGKKAEYMVPLGDGPYYGFRLYGGLVQTNNGIRIDREGRVCDPFFTPVKNLFAGGICVSGFNGEVYTMGTAQAVGLWSGSHVARYVVENILGGSVATDWYGEKDYDGPYPDLEGKSPTKPLHD
jgi:fumarate reductase flavoprotein subunit